MFAGHRLQLGLLAAARLEDLGTSRLEFAPAGKVQQVRHHPGNRLEALKGDRKGQWSIRINDRWRICFRFSNGDALDVEIVDYH